MEIKSILRLRPAHIVKSTNNHRRDRSDQQWKLHLLLEGGLVKLTFDMLSCSLLELWSILLDQSWMAEKRVSARSSVHSSNSVQSSLSLACLLSTTYRCHNFLHSIALQCGGMPQHREYKVDDQTRQIAKYWGWDVSCHLIPDIYV